VRANSSSSNAPSSTTACPAATAASIVSDDADDTLGLPSVVVGDGPPAGVVPLVLDPPDPGPALAPPSPVELVGVCPCPCASPCACCCVCTGAVPRNELTMARGLAPRSTSPPVPRRLDSGLAAAQLLTPLPNGASSRRPAVTAAALSALSERRDGSLRPRPAMLLGDPPAPPMGARNPSGDAAPVRFSLARNDDAPMPPIDGLPPAPYAPAPPSAPTPALLSGGGNDVLYGEAPPPLLGGGR